MHGHRNLKIGLQIVREDFVFYVAGGYERGKFSDGNDQVIEIYYQNRGNRMFPADI